MVDTSRPVVLADFPSGEVYGVWKIDPYALSAKPEFCTEFTDRDVAVAFARNYSTFSSLYHYYVVDTVITNKGAQRIA